MPELRLRGNNGARGSRVSRFGPSIETDGRSPGSETLSHPKP